MTPLRRQAVLEGSPRAVLVQRTSVRCLPKFLWNQPFSHDFCTPTCLSRLSCFPGPCQNKARGCAAPDRHRELAGEKIAAFYAPGHDDARTAASLSARCLFCHKVHLEGHLWGNPGGLQLVYNEHLIRPRGGYGSSGLYTKLARM